MAHEITVEPIRLCELPARCGEHRLSAHGLLEFISWSEPVCAVVPDAQRRWGEVLVWLPGVDADVLDTLARKVPYSVNLQSADFRTCRTMLVWEAEGGIEVHLDMWRICHAPFYWPVKTGERAGFGIVFMSQSGARYASHMMDGDDYEGLLAELQVCTASSGVNWNPWRIFGDEFMGEHEGRADEPSPGVITPAMLRPIAGG